MPRPKLDESLRHETAVEEDGFFDDRESGYVAVKPAAKKKTRGKGKRSIEDMMASMPNAPHQSVYVLARIAALEDQIAKLLSLCSEEAREIVLKQRPSLKRYAPEE